MRVSHFLYIKYQNFTIPFIIFCPACIDSDIINCGDDDGCHGNASCIDSNGSYDCVCDSGFTGDGFNCSGKFSYLVDLRSGSWVLVCLEWCIIPHLFRNLFKCFKGPIHKLVNFYTFYIFDSNL